MKEMNCHAAFIWNKEVLKLLLSNIKLMQSAQNSVLYFYRRIITRSFERAIKVRFKHLEKVDKATIFNEILDRF